MSDLKLLCDQNIAKRYIVAFLDAEDLIATTVRDALDPRAPDTGIAEFAAAHDWVVFTSDDDFFELAEGFQQFSQMVSLRTASLNTTAKSAPTIIRLADLL